MASIYPLWSNFFSKLEYIKYRDLLRNTLIVQFGVSLLVVIFGYSFATLIMRAFGGSNFFSSIQPFRILLLATPFFFLNNIFYYVILSFGKTKYLILPLLVSLIANVVINLYSIPRYGYIGTSVTTVITEIFTSLLYVIVFIRFFKSETSFILKF